MSLTAMPPGEVAEQLLGRPHPYSSIFGYLNEQQIPMKTRIGLLVVATG